MYSLASRPGVNWTGWGTVRPSFSIVYTWQLTKHLLHSHSTCSSSTLSQFHTRMSNWLIFSHSVTGILQGVLLLLCLLWRKRQAKLGIDDWGHPVVQSSVDAGGREVNERTRLVWCSKLYCTSLFAFSLRSRLLAFAAWIAVGFVGLFFVMYYSLFSAVVLLAWRRRTREIVRASARQNKFWQS